ncbi:MAG: hypothetical protein LBF82_00005, partial [Lactobacillales bacterium]|nr:hypothetical protein [Lactobacillales bacterium]
KGHILLGTLFLLLLITSLWNYIYSDYKQYHSFRKNNEQQLTARMMVFILRENGLETAKNQTFYFNTGKVLTNHQGSTTIYKIILNNKQVFQISSGKNGILNCGSA